MRWDRLLAEIEAAALDEATLERDALAGELVDEEWAAVRARDLIWGDVALDVRGVGWIEGQVVRPAEDFVVMTAGVRDVIVARSAVLGWRGGTGRAPELLGVGARLGWSQLLRAIRDDGEDVRVVRIDGSQVVGTIGAVAQDAIRVRPLGGADPGSTAVWVVLTAIATLQVV